MLQSLAFIEAARDRLRAQRTGLESSPGEVAGSR